ncbi:serine hydrolase [Erythrobacter arachoides]|uniref:serine-type D-Ala-D-Ala carboxypeptidase n=1 Tax=Aurantiacibacter arachoides TaxID=1850444 RepID=A0A845A2M8_9SPHN|nr:serine hydrolase [Aurantiacibacter arachoides]
MLVDLSSGQALYSREADRRFVPASVTKVMTAYTAFKLVDEGTLRLNMPFLYTKELEDQWYNEGSNMFLLAGERPTIAQLLLGVTTVSGNDASVALAVAGVGSLDSWLALMNANAQDLGMADTHFGSPNGFPDGGQTYTTARDLAALAEGMIERYPGLYRRFFGHRLLTWRDVTQANHDPVTGSVEGADGIKTGYTNEAGYTFVGSAERDGRRLVIVIAGAPNAGVRNRAARDMLEWGFDGFERRTLLTGGSIVGLAEVQDGSASSVPLRLPADFEVAIPREGGGPLSSGGDWRVEIVYRGPIEAPIARGAPIARMRFTMNGETVMETPLEADVNVARANAAERVANAVSRWTR